MDANLHRYYLKKASGGRTIIARTIDFVMFRALTFVVLFFLLLHLSRSLTTALLMSLFLTLGISIFLHIRHNKRIERYIKKDLAKLQKKCLLEALTMMDINEYTQYMSKLIDGLYDIEFNHNGITAQLNGDAVYIFHNHPSAQCGVSDILPLLRKYKDKALTIVSLSDFEQSAKTLCKQSERVRLMNGDEVLSMATQAGMLPDEQTAQQKAENEMREKVLTLSKIKNAALAKTKIRGYILCGLVAVVWPFITGFRFYYPLIAIACFALAFITRRKNRGSDESVSTY